MKNKNITPRRSPRRGGEQSFSLIFSDKLSEYSENRPGKFSEFSKNSKRNHTRKFSEFSKFLDFSNWYILPVSAPKLSEYSNNF